MSRAGPRLTVLGLMAAVMAAALLSGAFVAQRDRARRAVALEAAEAAYAQARMTREVAELAVNEYVQGVTERDGRVGPAVDNMTRAVEAFERSLRASEEDPSSDEASDETAVRWAGVVRARGDLARARERGKWAARMAPRNDPTARELKDRVEKAKADEAARKADIDRLKALRVRVLW